MSEIKITKSIPLAIFVGLLAQAGTVIWFASRLDSRVSNNEEILVDYKSVPTRVSMLEVKILSHEKEFNDGKSWRLEVDKFESEMNTKMTKLAASIDYLATATEDLKDEVKELNNRN